MSTRNILLQKGFFPETLPPCFDSTDLKRGFHGIVSVLKSRGLHKNRSTHYVRYIGTKHDGNRRPYATPNPISYFNVCEFISQFEKSIFRKFHNSSLSISAPRLGLPNEDRSIVINSLSELSDKLSTKIRYAPYIIKTDIAQFFPSIYTHAIPWVAHGITAAKADQRKDSATITFNKLDWYTQQCQNGQTRGVIIGPDAFRIVAEFIVNEIDQQLFERSGKLIIGGVRHVDDYYIGVQSEIEAAIVLSSLRDILQNFELQINDSKTKIISSLEPTDDLWAQNLRAIPLGNPPFSTFQSDRLLDQAYDVAKITNSASPLKLALRRLDQIQCYKIDIRWQQIENRLQRISFHFPHCVDYICLLLVKRHATQKTIDRVGWSEVAHNLISYHLNFDHHHEVCWMLWILIVCKLEISDTLIEKLSANRNSHILAMLIAAHETASITRRPSINFPTKLSSTDDNWLKNLVARSTGFTRANFGGSLVDEFEHLSSKKVVLLDFKKHVDAMAVAGSEAISRSKYGYDNDDSDDNDQNDDFVDTFDEFNDDDPDF